MTLDRLSGQRIERLVVYDGECRMCARAKNGLERVGGCSDIKFVPYQSEEAVRHLGAAYRPGPPDVAYLIEPDGTVRPGLEAFLPLLPGLPGGRIFLACLKFPLLRALAHWAYRVVARNRYRWFGTLEKRSTQE